MDQSNLSSPRQTNPKTHPSLPSLTTTSFQAQQKRQRFDENWVPDGFERYRNSYQLVKDMPVLGMTGDAGYPAERFEPPKENYG